MENILFQNNEHPIIHWEFSGTSQNLSCSKAIWSNLKDISLSNIRNLHVSIKNLDSLSQFIQLFHAHPISNIIIFIEMPLSACEDRNYKPFLAKYSGIKWSFTLPQNMQIKALSNDLYRSLLSQIGEYTLNYPFNKSCLPSAYQVAWSLFTQTGKTVILTPDISLKGTGETLSWKELDSFYSAVLSELKISGQHKGILMKKGILPLSLLISHPCNAYMCSGHNCHSGKGNHPRSFQVNEQGELYPITDAIPSRFCLGNLAKDSWNDIFTNDLYKEKHGYFLEVCRSVFDHWLQHCPFTVVPWETLFEVQARQCAQSSRWTGEVK